MENGALARLTEREKDCLRRWLRHETAKEIALDLGISPHAVEKRLKMARAKLGVSSSLEAARLLEASEGYQLAGPHSPDLALPPENGKPWLTRPQTLGAIAMTIVSAAILAVVLQAGGIAPLSGGAVPATGGVAPLPESSGAATHAVPTDGALRPGFVKATTPEITSIVQATFRNLDANNSGFLEGEESPLRAPPGPRPVYRRDERGNMVPTGQMIETSQAQLLAGFYAETDEDKDGKVSFQEYYRWSAPRLARQGIPARWKENMNRPIQPEG